MTSAMLHRYDPVNEECHEDCPACHFPGNPDCPEADSVDCEICGPS